MKKFLLSLVALLAATGMQAEQAWWGYFHEGDSRSAIGATTTGTYDQAIYIHKSNGIVAGNTIKGVRFYLRNAANVSNVYVWIATSMPASMSDSKIVYQQKVTSFTGGDEADGLLGVANEVMLNTPYKPTKGVYVGVTYTINDKSEPADQYPIVIGSEKDIKYSSYLRIPGGSWAESSAYGALAMNVLVDGTFATNSATPSDISDVLVAIDQPTTMEVTLFNGGTAGISSIDYTFTANKVEGEVQHLDLPQAYTIFGGYTTVEIPVAPDAEVGSVKKTLTITKVNGQQNEAATTTAKFTVNTVTRIIPRGIVVEEYTGTGCGWCPRGLAGMAKMRKTYGNQFVGIGIHGYNSSDPMYFSGYAGVNYYNNGFSGAPSCSMNRNGIIDPYYGSANSILDDFEKELKQPTQAIVSVVGEWNADSTEVIATATIEPIYENLDLTIEYCLIADSVIGEGNSWNQSNYYTQYNASDQPADIAQFCTGGIYGQSSIKGWAFDDVLIASCYKQKTNQTTPIGTLTIGQETTNTFTLAMPTSETLLSAIKKHNVAVVVMLVGSDGKIVNAAKYYMPENGFSTGINNTVQRDGNQEVARYAMDGRLLDAPQKGINIVKYADGRVVKVVVK